MLADERCGKSIIRFDYEAGENNRLYGIACREHRGSYRVEKIS